MKIYAVKESIRFAAGLLIIFGTLSVIAQVPPATTPPPATSPPPRTFPPRATTPPPATRPPPITRPTASQLVITNQIPLVPTNVVGGAQPNWGYAPHPVQGLNPHPIQGYAPAPVQGLSTKILRTTTNSQTGYRTNVTGIFSNNMLVAVNTNVFFFPATVPPGTRTLSTPTTNQNPSPF